MCFETILARMDSAYGDYFEDGFSFREGNVDGTPMVMAFFRDLHYSLSSMSTKAIIIPFSLCGI